MLKKTSSIKIFTVFLVMLFMLTACGSTPTPVPTTGAVQKQVTPGPDTKACDQIKEPVIDKDNGVVWEWLCTTQNGHEVKISHLPDGVQPYSFSFDETALMKMPKDNSIEAILGVSSDIRFFKQDGKTYTLVTTFTPAIQVGFLFNEQDLKNLEEYNINNKKEPKIDISALIPLVNFTDGANKWKRFPDGTVAKMRGNVPGTESQINGFLINIFDWGDPSQGPGIGRSNIAPRI